MSRVDKLPKAKTIFATVGTQCPFPRLINRLNEWGRKNPSVKVFAQTADPSSEYDALEAVAFVAPEEYQKRFDEADLVVAHAGMGTILTAIEDEKPLVVVPRKASLGEHRNEHQLGTVKRFEKVGGVQVAYEVEDIADCIDVALSDFADGTPLLGPSASLLNRIEDALSIGKQRRTRFLAVASGGGHWVQLCRLLNSLNLERCSLTCATTTLGDRSLAPPAAKLVKIQDCNRWSKVSLMRSAADALRLVAVHRPDVVLSTGAAPGFFTLAAGRVLRSKTIWLDSIANADEMSMSGRKAGSVADVWLTQWPEVATSDGPEFAGSVLPIFSPKPQPVRVSQVELPA